jgi:hypothetical protein
MSGHNRRWPCEGDHADGLAVGEQRGAFDHDLFAGRKAVDDRNTVSVHRAELDASQARDIGVTCPLDDGELPARRVSAYDGSQGDDESRPAREWTVGFGGTERDGSDHAGTVSVVEDLEASGPDDDGWQCVRQRPGAFGAT